MLMLIMIWSGCQKKPHQISVTNSNDGGDDGKVDGGCGEDDGGDGDIRQFWTLLNRGGSQCKHQGDGLIEISF